MLLPGSTRLSRSLIMCVVFCAFYKHTGIAGCITRLMILPPKCHLHRGSSMINTKKTSPVLNWSMCRILPQMKRFCRGSHQCLHLSNLHMHNMTCETICRSTLHCISFISFCGWNSMVLVHTAIEVKPLLK